MEFILTKYGRREWAGGTVLFVAAIGLLVGPLWRHQLAFWPAAAALTLVWAWIIAFFRDPDRRPPDGDGLFVSPADGRVADITPIGPDSPLGRDGVKIGVFMNIFNVHVNRSPCDGRVESVAHADGAFLDARNPLAAERNESATIVLTHERLGKGWPVVVRQVAGLVARRIVTDLSEGQTLACGQRIGMIKFGSRVELLLPRELAGEVRVSVGQRVQAGRTVLASAGT